MESRTTYRLYWPLAVFLFTMGLGFGQRLVLPGQELLMPYLNDPSFVAENKRVQVTALAQFSDFNTDRASQWVNAQLPIYDNLAFGVDYFNDEFDYYKNSQVLLTAGFVRSIGQNDYIKVGLSGGGKSQKIHRIPINQQHPNLVPNINENNIELAYRVGVHYSGRHIDLGGYYNERILHTIDVVDGQEDQLNYKFVDGYTVYLGYRIFVGQKIAITPMFRYLDYGLQTIYEGVLKLGLFDKVDASIAYRNDYSINPTVRFTFFKAWGIGYSFEKALGSMNFEDIHSFSLSYKFKKGRNDEEPEWLENAKKNIEEVEAIKEKKPRKEEKSKPEVKTRPEIEPAPIVKPRKWPASAYVSVEMSPRFYIVAGSFDTIDQAIALKEALKKDGHGSVIGSTDTDNEFYVFIDSDIDKNTALKRLADLKSNPIFKDAYLFEVK